MGRARLAGVVAAAAVVVACYVELRDATDHYGALSVSRRATRQEIRAGYKAKALVYHPDKVMQRGSSWYVRLWRAATRGEARCARRFIAISDAVDVLTDDERRADYDVELSRREAVARGERQRRRGELVQRLDVRRLREVARSPVELLLAACAMLIFWTYVAAPCLRGLSAPFHKAPPVAADREANRMRAIERQQAAYASAAAARPRRDAGLRKRAS